MTDFTLEKTAESTNARAHPGSDAVPMRPMRFEEWFADVPKYFAADGDIVMSHILAVLSAVFPDGEDFFVRSVSAVREKITDPRLAQDVEGFIGQESMHGREHRAFNDHLARLGYPTAAIGRYVQTLTALRERIQGRKGNLGFTAALEHYTATLAETLLGDPAAREQIGHPAARYLLLWHALEEAEHKAVAFDVFRAVGGTEMMRQVTMWITHLTFVLETGIWTAVSLAGDGYARRHPVQVARSAWKLRSSPFTSPGPVKQLLGYHRPGFHPDDRRTGDLVGAWRQKLFGPEGTLVELLGREP